MLYAFEFFNMNLNADMAVLSACNTGRVKGAHGLEGLVRGLFFAGVPSVVATLWTIEDGSSAELMSNFYLHLKQGVRKSKALQLAKLELIKSGKADPFHWAGYVLIGDSTPIDFSDFSNQTDWIKWSVLVLAVALIQILVYVTIMKE